jgi:hypothetical protein
VGDAYLLLPSCISTEVSGCEAASLIFFLELVLVIPQALLLSLQGGLHLMDTSLDLHTLQSRAFVFEFPPLMSSSHMQDHLSSFEKSCSNSLGDGWEDPIIFAAGDWLTRLRIPLLVLTTSSCSFIAGTSIHLSAKY